MCLCVLCSLIPAKRHGFVDGGFSGSRMEMFCKENARNDASDTPDYSQTVFAYSLSVLEDKKKRSGLWK